jgi:hypothetical protein
MFKGSLLFSRGLLNLLAEELMYRLADHGAHDGEQNLPAPARVPPYLIEGRLRCRALTDRARFVGAQVPFARHRLSSPNRPPSVAV